jgi:hypothetical protein
MAKAAAKTRQCLLAGVCGPSGDGIVATRRAQHRAGGGWMAKRQAEEVAVHLSQDLGCRLRPAGCTAPSADDKGQAPDDQKQHTRLSPEEKRNRTWIAAVVSVDEVAPYPRTGAQILETCSNSPSGDARLRRT